MENIKEWLNQEPDSNDIREKDGAKYIPYHIIVQKLNEMYDELGFLHGEQEIFNTSCTMQEGSLLYLETLMWCCRISIPRMFNTKECYQEQPQLFYRNHLTLTSLQQ